MPRDTIVSWRTFALFVLFPPLALAAVVLFPVTLLLLFFLYYRGKSRRLSEEGVERADESGEERADATDDEHAA